MTGVTGLPLAEGLNGLLPNTIIIGASKGGTTTLARILGSHPDAYMHPVKELRFFAGKYKRGIEWCEEQFAEAKGYTVVAEATPDYTFAHLSSTVAERIAKYLPNVKLVYITRHPLTRIESQYGQVLDNGEDIAEFSKVALNDPRFVESSMYQDRLNDYLTYFSREQIHVMFLDDLRRSPEDTISNFFRFLGLEGPVDYDPNVRLNNREEKRVFRPAVKQLKLHRVMRGAGRYMPRGFVNTVRPIFKEELSPDVDWDESVRREAIEQLRPNVHRFLEGQGRPVDMWDLS